MPLLTPLRLGGSSDPVLKEANYFQYLPHSREARSSRGQACETFLQQLPSLPSPALSSFLPLYLYSLSPLVSFCTALIFCICLFFHYSFHFIIHHSLPNSLFVIYFHFCDQHRQLVSFGQVSLAYFKVVAAAMLTAVRLSFH